MRFSIIIPTYDKSVSREYFSDLLFSLRAQTFSGDYEVLVYHDGPDTTYFDKYMDTHSGVSNITFVKTEKRYNNWGHSLRQLGLQAAKGEYIIHCNGDNSLDFNALEEIDKGLKYWEERWGHRLDGVTFSIVMEGVLTTATGGLMDVRANHQPLDYEYASTILNGYPIRSNATDAMQVVLHRDVWSAIGGWFDLSEKSDGIIFDEVSRITQNIRPIPKILGVHR